MYIKKNYTGFKVLFRNLCKKIKKVVSSVDDLHNSYTLHMRLTQILTKISDEYIRIIWSVKYIYIYSKQTTSQ